MLRKIWRAKSTLREVMDDKIHSARERMVKLKKLHSEIPFDSISVNQMVNGMQGVKALLSDTSRIDPYKGIKFRGLTVSEAREKLPAKYREPLPESMLWLLLTGEVPTAAQVEELRAELAAKAKLSTEVKEILKSLPKNLHPLTQLSIGVLALGAKSHFDTDYHKGMKKSDYWKPMLEDSINLVAKIPTLAATIYRNVYKDGKVSEPSESQDWSENYVQMLGWEDSNFYELMRLYLTLHCDHEGGNVTAHSSHLVGSALSDTFLSYSAGLNGLAGPLHGLASENCLKWLLDLQSIIGDTPTDATIEVYVRQQLRDGKKIPGYNHPILVITDPRFLALMDFSKKVFQNSPLCKTVEICNQVIPKILKDMNNQPHPYPNSNVNSGVMMYQFGLKEADFFTVNFGVSRSIGVAANMVWDRAYGLPIERPGSLTLENLEKLATPK